MATFNKIEEIQVGNNFKGVINSDGVDYAIISASYDQAYSDGPSTLSLTVLSSDSSIEMREYLGFSPERELVKGGKQEAPFSVKNIETISITNGSRSVFNFFGFLSSFSEKISAGERIYQIDFLDRSIILDKIFVGLTNRHMSVDKKVSGKVTVSAFCGNSGRAKSRSLIFGEPNGLGPKLATAKDFPYRPHISTEPFAGGRITVGDEQFTENFCSVAEVDYSFHDLIQAMSNAGIAVIAEADLAGLNSIDGLRRQYTGTLRSVLSRWCSDYGYSFVWEDSAGRKDSLGVRIFDMKKGLGNIYHLKEQFLKSGIQDLDYSEDRKSTETIGLVTRLIKPPSFSESQIDFSRKIPCSPVAVAISGNIPGDSTERPAVSFSFLITCFLAKYSQDIRTLWYLANMPSVGRMRYEALGLYVIKSDMNYGKRAESILKGFWMEDFAEIQNEWGNDFRIHLVYRSEDMERRHVEWEKDIADNFMGQYFESIMHTFIPDTTSCSSIFGRRTRLADSNPEFVAYGDDEWPVIENNPYGAIVGRAGASSKFRKIVKRNSAPWAGTFAPEKDSDLKTLTPRFVPVTPEAYNRLISARVVRREDVPVNFALGGARFQLGFLFVRKSLRRLVSVRPGNYVNPKEIPDYVINQPNNDSDTSKCTPKCSVDIGSFICGDTFTGSDLQPAISTKQSFGIDVTVDGTNYGTIIAPVGTNSQRAATFNRIETVNYKNFLSERAIKRFKHYMSQNSLKSASVNIVEEDMTPSVVFTADDSNRNINGSTHIIRNGEQNNLGVVNASANSSIDSYHKAIVATLGSSELDSSKSLSVTVPGHLLTPYSVKDGISSFSFSLSGDGSSTRLTFRSAPPKKPARDSVLREVKTITRHYRN